MTKGTGSGTGSGSRVGHTAGPWHVAFGLETVRDSSEYQVCYVESDYHTIDESHANARLIAAAPELLEALRAFVDAERDMHFEEQAQDVAGCLYCEAVAAIAKAEGRE